mgnify:FL=1
MLESLFNPENALMCFINKIIDLVVLSILWTLCSAPLVTMGAASSALYYALTKSVRCQRGHAAKEFWRAFKSNLKRGILFELVWAALAFMMLVTDVPLVTTFLDTGKVQNVFLLILFAVKAVLLIGAACWYYPMISRFEQGVWKTAEAAVFTMLRHALRSILVILLTVFAVSLLVAEPLLLAIVPGVSAWLLSFLQEPVFRALYDSAEVPEDDDPWYREL